MADSDDTSVMFEIGVMEHPATKSRIEALQKQVLDTQAKMAQGVERVGLAAQASAAAMTPLTAKASEFRKEIMDGYDDMRGAITRLVAEAETKMQIDVDVRGRAELDALLAQIKAAQAGGSGGGGGGGGSSGGGGTSPEPARIPKPDTTGVKDAFDELPASLRNVFQQLGEDSQEAADDIGDIFEKRLSGLANTQGLKSGFEDQMKSQVEKFAAASRELDDALDAKGESVEMLNANMVKATRSVIGAAKGFAELGLVSKENSEEMLKGLVVIQGAFDIFDGAADLLESFSGGWKAVKKSTDAAAAATQAQQALMGPQFALMRAYQAQLVQEAATANAAALANTRLAQSRGMGGAGGVASAAGGAAVQGVAGAVGTAGAGAVGGAAAAKGGAFLSTSVAGVTTGLLASVAAFGAALAAVGLVATEVVEIARGQADKQKSLTNKIASTEVNIAAGALQMTGMFNTMESAGTKFAIAASSWTDRIADNMPVVGSFIKKWNLLGDIAGLAASNITTAKAEKQLERNKINSELKERTGNVERAGANELAVQDFMSRAARTRSDAEAVGTNDSKLAAEFKIQAEALAKLADSQRAFEKAMTGEGTQAQAQAAAKDITTFEGEVRASQQRQTGLSVGKVDAALEAEIKVQKDATAQMRIQEEIASKLRADGVASSEELAAADAQAAKFRQEALQSLQRQKELVKEKTDIEVQGQQRVGELLKTQIDQKNQQIQRSQDERTNAVRNFANMNTFEKEQTAKALEQARTKGAASLNDRQTGLLERVNTAETRRFVNEANEAEAAKFGFDQSFGKGFAQEQAELIDAKKKLETQLNTTYDVSITTNSNTEQIVSDVMAAVNKALENESATIREQIQARMTEAKSAITIEMNDKFRQLNPRK